MAISKSKYKSYSDKFKIRALWRNIALKTDERYDQKILDLTKRNLLSTNNFSIIKAKDSLRNDGIGDGNDAIVDALYILKICNHVY